MFSLFDGLFDGFWGFFILIPAAGIGCAVLLVCALCIVFSIPYAVWCGWESPRDIPTISECNPVKGFFTKQRTLFACIVRGLRKSRMESDILLNNPYHEPGYCSRLISLSGGPVPRRWAQFSGGPAPRAEPPSPNARVRRGHRSEASVRPHTAEAPGMCGQNGPSTPSKGPQRLRVMAGDARHTQDTADRETNPQRLRAAAKAMLRAGNLLKKRRIFAAHPATPL